MTDDEMHAAMATELAKQRQALSDEKRRDGHFQVRLPPDLAKQLKHYMQSRDQNANQALNTIISQFFGTSHG
jgi:predicted HicB family RNase H-like nuclease